jgi:hypothetical protein
MGEKLMRPIEVRFEKNINNLTLVREADTHRQWEYVTVTMLGALFVLGALFYGWQRYRYEQVGYRIETEQKAHIQLIEKQNRLLLDRAQLQDPTHIASRAREMGMVPSVPGQLVTLDPMNPEIPNNSEPQLSATK